MKTINRRAFRAGYWLARGYGNGPVESCIKGLLIAHSGSCYAFPFWARWRSRQIRQARIEWLDDAMPYWVKR